MGGAWSENMAVPNVILLSWGIKEFAGIALPSVSQSIPQV